MLASVHVLSPFSCSWRVKPFVQKPAPSNPLLKIFYRRKRYDATVRVITKLRAEILRDVPINQLVPLAFFSTPSDLKVFGPDNPTLPLLVLQKYESEGKNNLFHDWQMFCKTVEDLAERSQFLLEGAIYFASQAIPEPQRRTWSIRGRELLQFLQFLQTNRLSPADDENMQSTNHSPSMYADSRFVAEMPEASLLREVLGGFLLVGMRQSHKRIQEEDKRLTSAVRLHFAAVHGEDFKLEVYVNGLTGSAITQANGHEDLVRDMLGDYLADAMEGSLWKQDEDRMGTTGPTKALAVVPAEPTDCRLFILLRFSTGKELFERLFPV